MTKAALTVACCLPFLGCTPRIGVSLPPGDSGPQQDTQHEPADTDEPETVPDAVAVPMFDPPGGGFVDAVTVTISSSSGRGDILACYAGPAVHCELEPYTSPIELTESTILHARVDQASGEGERLARTFVELDPTVESFSSDLPLLVFWTTAYAPTSSSPVPMGLAVFEPGAGRSSLLDTPTDNGRARLQVHGSSSAYMDKRSYDLELWNAGDEDDRRAALLGMPEDGDWILYAPYYYDEALVRNSLAMEISNNVGRYAPRTRYAELFLADQGDPLRESDYLGVYAVMEEIECGDDRIDITRLDLDDLSEPEITGGYLFKRDRSGSGELGFWAGAAGGEFTFHYPLVAVEPAEDELHDLQFSYLYNLLDELAWALAAEDHTNPTTGRHYSELVDVDSWIDHNIINAILKNPDAFRLSGYMYKDREGLIEAGPVWDFDRAAGAYDYRATYPTYWDAGNQTSDTSEIFTTGWYEGLFNDPAFADRYWARWRELIDAELSLESLLAITGRMEAELEEAAVRNTSRWGSSEFHGQMDALESWLTIRHGWISACLETYKDPAQCPG